MTLAGQFAHLESFRRFFWVHMPLALALGLLPFVIKARDWRYPFFGAIGRVTLTYRFGYGYIRSSPDTFVPEKSVS